MKGYVILEERREVLRLEKEEENKQRRFKCQTDSLFKLMIDKKLKKHGYSLWGMNYSDLTPDNVSSKSITIGGKRTRIRVHVNCDGSNEILLPFLTSPQDLVLLLSHFSLQKDPS